MSSPVFGHENTAPAGNDCAIVIATPTSTRLKSPQGPGQEPDNGGGSPLLSMPYISRDDFSVNFQRLLVIGLLTGEALAVRAFVGIEAPASMRP